MTEQVEPEKDNSQKPKNSRTRKILILSCIGIIVIGLTIGGISWLQHNQTQTSQQTNQYTQNIAKIDILSNSGHINIETGTTNTITVEARSVWKGATQPESIQDITNGTLKIRNSDCGWALSFGRCSIDYTITTPPATDVTISANSGDVETNGITGTQKIDVDSGNIHVSEASGNLDIDNDSGSLELDHINSNTITIEADSGDITMTDINSNTINADASSGDITARFTTAPNTVTIEADSGNVKLIMPNDNTAYRVNTTIDSGHDNNQLDIDPNSTHVLTIDVDSGDCDLTYA